MLPLERWPRLLTKARLMGVPVTSQRLVVLRVMSNLACVLVPGRGIRWHSSMIVR